ncbi:hypothetical protein ATCC90586_004539 [Pythium insidiosum]|nr:hypothetical protein ATCC90586_004539 [Pythium insidiosum]
MNNLMMFSLKRRVESFSSDDSFDVLSMDDFDVAAAGDDVAADADAEWEDVAVPEPIVMDDDGVPEAPMDHDEDASLSDDEGEGAVVNCDSTRRISPREALRDFYLMKAKESEEQSKKYRADAWTEELLWRPPVIAPLRALERYPLEVVERVLRDENARKAKLALRAFYAQRSIEKERRASLNRANEAFLRQSQRGLSCNQELSPWEAALARPLDTAS